MTCEHNSKKYNQQEKIFVCVQCGEVEKVIPTFKRCFSCGFGYYEYIWYDPTSCENCKRSFLD